MADSILRLRVSSEEYDNKLKQAAQGLTRYADECRKVGGTLEVVEKETLDYVRALGQMDTTSRTATGKLAEMKKTFTELSVVYKNMTDEEKNSPFGKALATSLDQLKGRIGESKVQLDDINKSINGGGGLSGALDAVAGKFGLSIDQITKFGGVVGAASAALKVSKDAFFASEQNIDEWGRVVASGESVYEGFLTALNTGDISGYLNNINTIINAAREAYNELDRLSTQKAIDNSRSKAQQTENERMRAMLRTGRYIAPNDGRKAAMAEGTILTDAQKQRIAQQLENGLKTANSIVRSEIDQTTKAINALYKEQASVLQMSSKEFRAGTSSMAEFDKRLEGYKNYVDFERQHTYNDGRSAVSHRDNVANPYEQYKAWGVFKDDGKLFQKINDLINQRASLQSQNYSNVAQAYRSINIATKPGSGGGGRSGRSGSSKGFDISSIAFDSNKAMLSAVKGTGEDGPSEVWKAITEGAKEATNEVDNLTAAFEKLNEAQGVTVKDANKESKNMSDSWRTASAAIGAVGNAMSGLKNPAIDIMTVIGQSIATIALAYAQNLAKDKTTTGNIWAFIAAAAAATISMATTIASIHSSTGYAQGGIVKGNSYSGDNIYGGPDAMVNAGELVLTKAQQSTLAQNLQNNGGTVNVVGRVVGEDIFLSADRYARRSGRGGLLTGKNL